MTKSQVVMQLFPAEEWRASMHKAHFIALQAILGLSWVW
jgi:hypothetical protein